MKKILFFFIIFLILLLILFVSYFSKNNKNFYMMNNNINCNYLIFENNLNKNKIITKKEPKRIISLSPEITDMILSINAEDKLIGITKYCDFSKIKKNKVKIIGDLFNYNLELIVKLKPDFVIASFIANENIIKKFQKFNIPIIIIPNVNNFEDVYKNLFFLGKILNKKKESDNIIKNINEKLINIKMKLKKIKNKPKICYFIDFQNGNFVATGDTFINDLIEKAGGYNIAKNSFHWEYSFENILLENPQIIILDDKSGTIEYFKKYKQNMYLDAVKNNNIYLINSDFISRYSTKLIDGLEKLIKIIHPEI